MRQNKNNKSDKNIWTNWLIIKKSIDKIKNFSSKKNLGYLKYHAAKTFLIYKYKDTHTPALFLTHLNVTDAQHLDLLIH